MTAPPEALCADCGLPMSAHRQDVPVINRCWQAARDRPAPAEAPVDEHDRETCPCCGPYEKLLYGVSRVYDHVTGGRISKPGTDADVVKSVADDRLNEWVDEAVEEAAEELRAEGRREGEAAAAKRIAEYLRGVGGQYAMGDMVPQDDYIAEAYHDAAAHVEAGAHLRPATGSVQVGDEVEVRDGDGWYTAVVEAEPCWQVRAFGLRIGVSLDPADEGRTWRRRGGGR